MPHPIRDYRRRRRVDVRADYLLQDVALGATQPRSTPMGSQLTVTGGTLWLFAVGLRAGRRISTIEFVNGTTALAHGSGNNSAWWFALYNASRILLGQTANQGQAAWAANTVKALALTTPVVIPGDGVYYAGLMVYPGTGGSPAVPTPLGGTVGLIAGGTAPILAGTSTTGLTGASAPNPAAALTAVNTLLWCRLT